MRARDVIGRRIKRVRQSRFLNRNTGRVEISLDWLELDNGAVLSFSAAETDVAPYVAGTVSRPRRGGA